jgi:hypothetical protein
MTCDSKINLLQELKLRLDIQLQTIASGGEHYGKTPAICIGQVKKNQKPKKKTNKRKKKSPQSKREEFGFLQE